MICGSALNIKTDDEVPSALCPQCKEGQRGQKAQSGGESSELICGYGRICDRQFDCK